MTIKQAEHFSCGRKTSEQKKNVTLQTNAESLMAKLTTKKRERENTEIKQTALFNDGMNVFVPEWVFGFKNTNSVLFFTTVSLGRFVSTSTDTQNERNS